MEQRRPGAKRVRLMTPCVVQQQRVRKGDGGNSSLRNSRFRHCGSPERLGAGSRDQADSVQHTVQPLRETRTRRMLSIRIILLTLSTRANGGTRPIDFTGVPVGAPIHRPAIVRGGRCLVPMTAETRRMPEPLERKAGAKIDRHDCTDHHCRRDLPKV